MVKKLPKLKSLRIDIKLNGVPVSIDRTRIMSTSKGGFPLVFSGLPLAISPLHISCYKTCFLSPSCHFLLLLEKSTSDLSA